VLDLPLGSEVLISAANITDMTRIVEHHGLIPVPVDLEVGNMAPTVDRLRRAITPATRAMMVAHLFGARVPLEPMISLAKEHNLLFFEDCAQVFDGGGYRGHPDSDVVMFSFGPVKSATALGGAILRVRNPDVLREMRQRQATYPLQTRSAYGRRLLKYAIMKWGSSPSVFAAAVSVCRLLGRDYDRIIGDAAHGFSVQHFFPRIRQQPSGPLVAMLNRRLRTYDPQRVAQRAARGRFLAGLLRDRLQCPAATVVPNSYWAFPIVVDNPGRVIEALCRAGFDSTQGHNLFAGHAPPGRAELDPVAARDALARMIYLPCYPEMPNHVLEQMAQVLLRECNSPAPQDSTRLAQAADVS
jgi:perosamine synthetase